MLETVIKHAIENSPALGVLLYIAMRQERLISTVVEACIAHLAKDADRNEIANSERLGR